MLFSCHIIIHTEICFAILECNCNDHSETCEFSKDVFIKSGHVSGSVCDNCLHNTTGNNCEKCLSGFYHDPRVPIHHPYTCQCKFYFIKVVELVIIIINYKKKMLTYCLDNISSAAHLALLQL